MSTTTCRIARLSNFFSRLFCLARRQGTPSRNILIIPLIVSCLATTLLLFPCVSKSLREFGQDTRLEQAIVHHAKSSKSAFIASTNLLPWLRKLQQDSPLGDFDVCADDIVFIVMASISRKERVKGQRSSWMRWAKNVIILADGSDDELGIMTLPEIANKTGFADAQWRQLHGMRWLRTGRSDLLSKKWFFLVDDDTWVNVPLLTQYTSKFPSALPLSFSHIYLMYSNQAVYNGGAGMLFTSKAFHMLAAAVLTERCPNTEVDTNFMNNDNILAACAHRVGVLKVSSSKFSTYEGILHLKDDIVDTSWLDQITVHKVTEPAISKHMYCFCEVTRGQNNTYCNQPEEA